MRWSFASRSSRPSTPVSCQRVSQVGAVSGMSFCQKPGAPAPLGNRWRLSGRSARWVSITGRDPGEVADELALGDRRVGLEDRLVEVGHLEVVAADLPDALLAERVEGGEFGVGGLPRVLGRGGRLRLRIRFRARLRLRFRCRHVDLRRGCFGFGFTDRRRRGDRPLASHGGGVTTFLEGLERGLADGYRHETSRRTRHG